MKKLLILVLMLVGIGFAVRHFLGGPKQNEPIVADARGPASLKRRLIVLHDDLGRASAEVKRNGGEVKREMKTVRGLVVEVPGQAEKNLKDLFGQHKVLEDLEMKFDPPMATDEKTESEARAKGGRPKRGSTSTQQIPWGMKAIHAPDAYSVSRGAGVQVCIVDTGIDATHPDLKANIVGGRNFVATGAGVDPAAWTDDNGHGSHVAGIVAALDNTIGTIGVAPQASLYAVKVLGRTGSGYLSDVADGVTECVQAGAKVINMSLGATGDPTIEYPLKTAVENAAAAGVVIVVAAGNNGVNISTQIPAGYPQVIAVAAVDSSMNFPSWSNFGLDQGDFSAPGVSVYSTWMSGGYNTISGTSMASPHVAGVFALKIASSSLGVLATDLGKPVSVQGAGLVDALKTVNNR